MADINIRIGAKLDGLQRSIKQAQSRLTRFADFAERVGSDLSTRLTLPVLGVGTAAVSSFAKFEKLELGLKAIAEEGENAGETLERLQKIAQLPGISLEQAVKGANQLRNVGFEARQAEAILTELSKAVTLSGEGPEQLQAVVRQLVQMSAKGRILQEDLGIIQENVPSIGLAIQDAFGTQNIEDIRATGVSTQEFTARITQAIAANEKFQSVQGGLSNEFDNFRQSVTLSLATLGKTIAESINLSGILQKLSSFLQNVTKRFKELSPGVQRFIVIVAGVAAAIGPVLVGFGAIIKVGASVVAAIKLIGGALAILAANPIGIAVVAIGGLILAFRKAFTSSDKFRATILGVGAVIKKFATDAVRFLRLPFDIISDLFSGDLEAATERALNVFRDNGKNAGEVFAEAYNKSIAESSARNFGTQGRLGGSRSTQGPAQDLSQTFANLPTAAATGGGRRVAAIVAPIQAGFAEGIKSVRSFAAETTGLFRELERPISQLGASIQTVPEQLTAAQETIRDYQAEIQLASDKNTVLGDSFSGLSQKIEITRSALAAAVEEYGLNSEVVLKLREQLEGYNEQMSLVNAQQERFNILAGGIEQLGETFGNILESGAASFKKFAAAALNAIADIIGALIKQGVAAAITGSIQTAPGPVGLALAAAAGGIASSLLKGAIAKISPPKLARGGLAFGPTLAVVGDNVGASSDPEVIAPLSKLKDYIGGAGNGEFVLRGSDLILAMDRANYNRSRRTGG